MIWLQRYWLTLVRGNFFVSVRQFQMPRCFCLCHGAQMWGTGASTTHIIQSMLKTEMKFVTGSALTRSTTVSILRSHVSAACLMEIKCCPHRHGPTSVTMTDGQTPVTFTHSVMLCCILFAFVIRPQQRIVCWQLIKINSV